jgi:flavin reductase (DIM6/NTAB) family NADH-FMN oxidoreductase RutF
MFYDATKRDHGLPQDPLKSLIVPRPIGWISTVDRQGRVNLAPYSFYNAVSEYPPVVYFAITGTYGSTPTKHSRMNAESTGEFVVNMVSEQLKEQMNVTTTMVEFGIDELKMAGLTPEPSTMVKPPRVKESPVALECKYWRTIELPVEKGHETKRGSVVFGQVVGVHIDGRHHQGRPHRHLGLQAGRTAGLQRIHHDRQCLAHEKAGRSEVTLAANHRRH